MPLRKSPLRTSALLAANRANARDSTRPRSPQGKAPVALNALQQGRYAVRLRENHVRAGEGAARVSTSGFPRKLPPRSRPAGVTRNSMAARAGARRERRGGWEQSRNVPWNQSLRRRGTPPHCGFELTTVGGGSGWCSGCNGTGTGPWTGRSCFARFGIDSGESGSARLSHPGQRSWGAGLRNAGSDGIGAGARWGGKRQPRMRVWLMHLAGDRRTNRVGPLESTEDQGALRTLRLRIGAEGSPSSL